MSYQLPYVPTLRGPHTRKRREASKEVDLQLVTYAMYTHEDDGCKFCVERPSSWKNQRVRVTHDGDHGTGVGKRSVQPSLHTGPVTGLLGLSRVASVCQASWSVQACKGGMSNGFEVRKRSQARGSAPGMGAPTTGLGLSLEGGRRTRRAMCYSGMNRVK